jgi:C1A family cysteine protease
LPDIKDQGGCGSCWAFGTVATLESIRRIRDNSREKLSEQQLVSCDRTSYGCQGGFFAHDYHVSPGAALDADFPYRAVDASCRTGLSAKAKITDWAYVGGSDQKRPTVEQIKQAIFDHGPVTVIVHANSSMQAYRSGVFNNCTNAQENHMVNLVGWDDAGGYWIMRNSWGKGWGDKGYMNIKYGCNNIASVAAFVNYKSTACAPMPTVYTGENLTINRGDWVSIGSMPVFGQTYQWSPATGLDDPTASMPIATPDKTTVYTLKVQNRCGISEKQIKITVN